CLKEFGHYGRYLIELESGEAGVHPVEIKRYRCTSCSHTHAL
ncbi:MAG TPA: transposase, partial [Lachnospiraceae bacterium]|nr:transposase [Lachnospiraceae bacterium]